jgi:hypothetical protein
MANGKVEATHKIAAQEAISAFDCAVLTDFRNLKGEFRSKLTLTMTVNTLYSESDF